MRASTPDLSQPRQEREKEGEQDRAGIICVTGHRLSVCGDASDGLLTYTVQLVSLQAIPVLSIRTWAYISE